MKTLPGGNLMIHHGPESQPRAKGRVAIIL